jgi:hypothetical protein
LMIKADVALEPQLGCLFGEPRNGNTVSEDIVDPAHCAWSRINVDPGIQEPLIVAIAGPEHDPVLTEGDWLLVAVGRDVPNREKRHLMRRIVR